MSKAKINNLFETREHLRFCERQLGIDDLSENSKAVLAFIAKDESTIQGIHSHSYFENLSLSTVKRSVSELFGKELIIGYRTSGDKRERILRIR
jgi:DNA-binding MarR family transcriptional regulator